MTRTKSIIPKEELKQILSVNGDFLKPPVQTVLQEILEAEMNMLPAFRDQHRRNCISTSLEVHHDG